MHDWAVISKHGVTCIGILKVFFSFNTTLHHTTLQAALLPFIMTTFSDGHCFQHDNDPKHMSNYAKKFIMTFSNGHCFHQDNDPKHTSNYTQKFIMTISDGHCFSQDKDPKHTSNYTKNFLLQSTINWRETTAESKSQSNWKTYGFL